MIAGAVMAKVIWKMANRISGMVPRARVSLIS